MAYTKGFWAGGMVGTADRMNSCLLGWGLYSEFPTATADNKGALSLATDRNMIYYSNGAQWVQTAIAPPASLTKGDIIFFDGTKWDRLPPGTQGQVLTTQGAGANPVWGSGGLGATMARVTLNKNVARQNQSGKLVIVSVTANIYAPAGQAVSGLGIAIGPTSNPPIVLGQSPTYSTQSGLTGSWSTDQSATFLVPPTHWYKIVMDNYGTVNDVIEWTLG